MNPLLADIPANTALNLGLYVHDPIGPCDTGNPTGFCGIEYALEINKILFPKGGHSGTEDTSISSFDLTTALQWMRDYAPTPVADLTVANLDEPNGRWLTTLHPLSRHEYDAHPWIPTLGEMLIIKGVDTGGGGGCIEQQPGWVWQDHPGKMHYYNPLTQTWRLSTLPAIYFGSGYWSFAPSAEFDPPSGKVLIQDAKGMAILDPTPGFESMTMIQKVGSNPGVVLPAGMGNSNNLVYFPPTDRHYYINSKGSVWEVALNRSVWTSSIVTPLITTGPKPPFPTTTGDAGETGFAYDPVNQVIGGGVINGNFYSFEPVNRVWSETPIQGGYPSLARVAFHCLAYAILDGVYIWISKEVISGQSVRKTWAFRLGEPGPQ